MNNLEGSKSYISIAPSNHPANAKISYKDGNPVINFVIGEQERYLIGDSLRITGEITIYSAPDGDVGTPVQFEQAVNVSPKLSTYGILDQVVLSSQKSKNVIESVRHYGRYLASFLPVLHSKEEMMGHLGVTANIMPNSYANQIQYVANANGSSATNREYRGNSFCLALPTGFLSSGSEIGLSGRGWGVGGLSIDLPIRCDAGLFIDGVLNNIKEVPDQQYNWIEKCKKWKNWVEEREIREDNILTSYEVVDKISTLVKPADVIIPDEGGHLVWCMQKFKIDNQRIFSNFGNSSMGYALPSAIGAAIGTGNRVICIDGDGGFQMNIQELQTVKNYNLPIKIIIINNGCYGIIKQFQDAYCESRYIATDGQKDYTLPDFERVAKAYGIESVTIEGKKDIDKKLNYVMSYEGPILCNIKIDPTQKLIPKLEFGNPLEDMYPYLTDKQISDNMVIKTIKRRDNTQGWVNLK